MSSGLIDRRRLLGAGASLVLAPAIAPAQANRVRRIGYLSLDMPTSDASTRTLSGLREHFRRAGYVEGVNLVIDARFAEGRAERLPELAADLVRSKVELVIGAFNHAIAAAARATSTVPVVMLGALVPVELGFARSYASPGGNVTGTLYSSPDTSSKLLELLRELAPSARKIAVLSNPAVPGGQAFLRMYETAARAQAMSLQFHPVTRPDEVAGALHRISLEPPDAILIAGDAVINPSTPLIAEFARERRIVTLGTAFVHVRLGGLLYYGPDFDEMLARVAQYALRILGGAKPGDLPIETPSRYELVINRRTADALRLKLPHAVELRVQRFID